MTSHPEFGAGTTASMAAPALGEYIRGKTVVVTGVSPASIGYTTVTAIASQEPALLILASRTQQKLDAVVSDLAKLQPLVPVHTVLLDLGSAKSVRAAAAQIGHLTAHVDVLINNAGVSMPERHPLVTPNGAVIDSQFYINYLGVFLLTSLLLPFLKASAEQVKRNEAQKDTNKGASTRIVNVSSQGHQLCPVRFSDYAFFQDVFAVPVDEQPVKPVAPFFMNTVDGYPGFFGYAQSKSANILHATELSRRLRSHGIVAFSVHPGTIETELSRSLDTAGRETIAKTARKGIWKTQDQGAATTIIAAFDPLLGQADVGGDGGTIGYLSDCQLHDDMAAPHAADAVLARRLWEESERLLSME